MIIIDLIIYLNAHRLWWYYGRDHVEDDVA